MAMHKSEELSDCATVLFKELSDLGGHLWSSGFVILDEADDGESEFRATDPNGKLEPAIFMTNNADPSIQNMYEAWTRGEDYFEEVLSGDAIDQHYANMLALPKSGQVFQAVLDSGTEFPTWQQHHAAYFSHGYILVITLKSFDNAPLLMRFANVFEQTYTRFLDLQKAESSAREAQIETALERVRSRTMAMHKSEELAQVIQVLFDQFLQLNIFVQHAGFLIDYKNRDDMLIWLADENAVFPQISIPYFDSPHWNSFLDAKEKGLNFFTNHLNFEEKNLFYQKLFTYIPNLTDEIRNYYLECPGLAISTVLLENVGLYIENFEGTPYTDEENSILLRFGSVFQQSYTRFLDLQKVEDRALEAQIEAAVERVRSTALSMQKTSDLQKVVDAVFAEMNALDIGLDHTAIVTLIDDSKDYNVWVGSADENFTTCSRIPYNDLTQVPRDYNEMIAARPTLLVKKYEGDIKREYSQYLFSQTGFKDNTPEKELRLMRDGESFTTSIYMLEHTGIQIVSYAAHIFTNQDHNILKRFANVFEQAYIRFMDIQKAEIQAKKILEERNKLEQTLAELKSTQAQLIHAEKMASLGELTAGIAHEIQNPLNFVNNFSDVSKDLLVEMKEELKVGNFEDAAEISQDLITNLEKIRYHGDRAATIVNGMLMHSRSDTGDREPTDLNALCDEYLRLAYHGLRAKDSTFNATIKTDFDEDLPKIKIVPQEIGRVLLNLITNAFNAVHEKSKNSSEPDYSPLVTVRTCLKKGTLNIAVIDNGSGIPEEIKDKIFQPFFTTKPTGSGTGLGLSLSFDIVRAHGGS